MLVINSPSEMRADFDAPDINRLRYEGFLAVTEKHFGRISHEVGYLTTDMRSRRVESQIEKLLASKRGSYDALYFIAAFNAQFIQALQQQAQGDTVIVLHDMDPSSNDYRKRTLWRRSSTRTLSFRATTP